MSRLGMPLSSRTCLICQSILTPGTGPHVEKVLDPLGWTHSPSQTWEVFYEAARNHCIICSAVCKHHERHGQASLESLREKWRPLLYRVDDPGDEEGMLQLNMVYKGSVKRQLVHLDFCLVDADSTELAGLVNLDGGEAETRTRIHVDDQYERLLRPAGPGMGSSLEGQLTMAYAWFRSCRSTHASCGQLARFSPDTLPSRLIDTGNIGDTHWVLRVTGEDGVPDASPYMTLSYRWGTRQTLRLLSSNMTQLRQGSPIDQLPQTFRDFITLARRFGIQYVWIDALCIVQDCTRDWEEEAPRMRDVYANSACNVAASASSDPEQGIFSARRPRDARPGSVLISSATKGPSPYYIYEADYWEDEIDGPLRKRGWVFQERFLASRVIYFGANQVLWECLTDHMCEDFPRGMPKHNSEKRAHELLDYLAEGGSTSRNRLRVTYLWNDLVGQYSQCELTKPSDKLFAIAGVARLFRDVTGDEYLAGWWRSHLLASLDWRVDEPRRRLETGYRAPSWSWASVDGPVVTTGIWAEGVEFLLEIVDAQVTAQGPDMLVNITDGFLKLKAGAIKAVCHYPDDAASRQPGDARREIVCIPYKKDHLKYGGGRNVARVMFLIAEDAGTRQGRGQQHRRIGHFHVYEEEWVTMFGSRSGQDLEEIILV